MAAPPQSAVVALPVVDVWSKTVTDPDMLTDSDRETQLLQGEKVLVHESSGEWIRVEAVEQPEYTHHNRWEGYPGWILKGPEMPLDFSTGTAHAEPDWFNGLRVPYAKLV